eukprot:CAMPEP_0114111014 /NCGR_PEP_ID=MMETSP0043_2-20121206/1621_1 /TAXON_ID=464988 /ORGANISM="Hemiselmis andersenii, Strain CCMP644" /LENGTH=133 /DNA_ID=CAMNT_0001203005 /DNA_START=148 /DNA_END=549 /DNA_ORIENTATION=-
MTPSGGSFGSRMAPWAAVGGGAVVGAIARYEISELAARAKVKPWGIAGINVAGSFVLGSVVASAPLSPASKLLIGTGFCGAFTTFSTFSVDALTMIEAGKMRMALQYMAINNIGGIGAAAVGMWLFSGGKRLK